jgi:hypothetical protein
MNSFLDNYFNNPNMNNQDYFASGMLCVFLAIVLYLILVNTTMLIYMSVWNKRRALGRGEIESLPRWIVLMDKVAQLAGQVVHKVTAKFSRKDVTL